MKWLDRFRRARPRPRDLIDLCRALDQRGWEHLHAADARGRGVILLIDGDHREVARRAVAAWLDPAVGVDAHGLAVATSDETLARHLAAGQRVVLDGAAARERAARLAADSGSTVLRVTAEAGTDGKSRLSLRRTEPTNGS